jgi:ActR/RegA family two-component response regulator
MSVLDACGGNRAEAARRLGVARKTVDRQCAAWGI